MKKRIVVFLMVVIISLSVVFTACNKDVYTDPSTGNEYILVTDENGEKVLNDDGELLVYSTDEDGKKIKDEDGNYVTEVHGFIGQIENDGVIEDYAYYFTLPDGWKAVNDRGEFENKKKGLELDITIYEKTYQEYYEQGLKVYNSLLETDIDEDDVADFKVYWEELDYDNADTKVCLFSLASEETITVTMFFGQSNNLYILRIESDSYFDIEEAKKEMVKIYESLEFKPYTYYPDLTEATTTE